MAASLTSSVLAVSRPPCGSSRGMPSSMPCFVSGRAVHIVKLNNNVDRSRAWSKGCSMARRGIICSASGPWGLNLNIFSTFGGGKNRESLKNELLETISPLQKGAAATPEDVDAVEKLCQMLEAKNPNPKSLASPLLNGKWELIYTTSESILGLKKLPFFRPNGPIYQAINADELAAQNLEPAPFFNQVTAKLEPVSESEVNVQFQTFKIFGLIPIKSPETARGTLDITYVDEDMRISRGNRGNLFVLLMRDPDYKIPLPL